MFKLPRKTKIKARILKHFCASPPLFQRPSLNSHKLFKDFYGSRGRMTRFVHYGVEKLEKPANHLCGLARKSW